MAHGLEYQVIQPLKYNTYDFIFEIDETGAKKLQRNVRANQDIVCLTNVPFPPKLSVEDLLKPRNDKYSKMKVPNKFFIYRKWYTMCLTDNNMKNDQTSISPHISKQWRNEPQEVKDYYGDLSKRASELFIEKYGKGGIERKIPKKIQKNKKTQNKGLPEIQPKIKEENLNSTGMFEPFHQPLQLETSPLSLQSLLHPPHQSVFVQAPDFTYSSPESQKSHSSEINHTYDCFLNDANNNMSDSNNIYDSNSNNHISPTEFPNISDSTVFDSLTL
ncbi:hypothetical protein Glove_606g46 [Diversispora epigaea]|uniref:HMG box domain-containing protein n=1 Tax=Diversispora epigaea TaxID=1348612 RepID=A0A397GB72_9GLOM|nr:hypothetical protein Glove_606g46 [Diversispora epigaea]